MNQNKETAKENREQLIRELVEIDFPEKRRNKVLSIRLEEALFKAISEQAEEWNLNISETVRKVLTFYFLPVALELKWRKVLPGAELENKRYSELVQLNLLEELYHDFKKGSLSMKYLLNEAEYIQEVTERKFVFEKEKLEELFMPKLDLKEVQ